jgi:MerR family transcriptional regulator, thiopeptide resistance regulator
MLRAMSGTFLDIIPVVPYRDIRAGHDFLVDVLSFSSGGIAEDGDGNVVHGEVRAGDRRIWLHAAQTQLAPPGDSGTASAGLVVQVADVDAHFARAREHGAHIVREPTDEEYGQREYGVLDPEGHPWYFATPFAQPAGR